MPNRTLICTLAALASGAFGFWAGGQINLALARQACEARSWGVDAACKVAVVPGALWKGSTTGLWVGTILGAFVAGTVTRKSDNNRPIEPTASLEPHSVDLSALGASEVTLTPTQDEVLRCLTVLLTTQSEATASALREHEISLEDLHPLLVELGFSEAAIAQAWRMFVAVQEAEETEEEPEA